MIDYSKLNNIEISVDEDETHHNIDTPSLFRWRHQARVARMEEHKKEVEAFERIKADHEKKYLAAKQNLLQAEKSQAPNLPKLLKTFKELEKENNNIEKIAEDLKKKEKKTPRNVDTISKPGFSKTVIKAVRPKDENPTNEEKDSRIKEFWKEREKELKHYGILHKFDESSAYLLDNEFLLCEYAEHCLVSWYIYLEKQQKRDLMTHVAHQVICVCHILQLSKDLDCNLRSCVTMVYNSFQQACDRYKAFFVEQHKLIIRKIIEHVSTSVIMEEERIQEVFDGIPNNLQNS